VELEYQKNPRDLPLFIISGFSFLYIEYWCLISPYLAANYLTGLANPSSSSKSPSSLSSSPPGNLSLIELPTFLLGPEITPSEEY
jgi:hypothetical protein